MLKDRSDLEKYLIKKIVLGTAKQNSITATQEWCLELYKKYNIPINMSTDIMAQRKDLSEYNEFILFAFTDVINDKKLSEYFTTQEIKLFTGEKYNPKKFKFPLKLHLIKITDEQYIGKTTAQFLMQLRENQMINYNSNTQRALRIMLRGGEKILRPYINDTAVSQIDDCFAEGIFIPNMLTFNMNLDDEKLDYSYDDEKEELRINNITAFDIVDGYHRYLGLSRNYDRDNQFDYPMMIQVSAFSLGRAKQLIYQEDHKTKMKEVDSASFNQYDPGNMVVNRLNTDTDCNMNGKIVLGTGLINPGILGKVINRLYFKTKPDRKEIIKTSKNIKQKLNMFTEEADDYLDKKWTNCEIIIIMYGLFNDYNADKITDVINSISDEDKKYINKLGDITHKVETILKEVF